MDTRPKEKSLRVAPFATHATRGIIRDQATRRKAMFVLLLVALAMVVSGATLLQETLNPREHLGRFLLFWAACAWFTITALLLALFDVLMLRAQGRAARRALGEQFSATPRAARENDESA
ncbi:MAG TPA: hypothetical protein VF551_08050 [Chthoniobacterales bacterium]